MWKCQAAGLMILALVLTLLARTSAADEQSLYEQIAANSRYTILLSAVRETGMVRSLSDKASKCTLFAPTDEAFLKLGDDELNRLIADKQQLRKLVEAHIVMGKVITSKQLMELPGGDINGFVIRADKADLRIGDARIIAADKFSNNGVMHVIDAVLIPKKS